MNLQVNCVLCINAINLCGNGHHVWCQPRLLCGTGAYMYLHVLIMIPKSGSTFEFQGAQALSCIIIGINSILY